MKRYYTVKEAAHLLGVSTNTIYTYLDSGKLSARRIGKGRFKIPFSQLSPFIQEEGATLTQLTKAVPLSQVQAAVTAPVQQKPIAIPEEQVAPTVAETSQSEQSVNPVNSDSEQELQTVSDGFSPMQNDKIFWRLFKGLSLLGLGAVYAFTANYVFNFSGSFFEESAGLINFILPYALMITGALILLDVFYEEKVRYFDTLIHFVTVVVLMYFSFVSLMSGEYGRLVFASPLAILTIIHLVQGVGRHKGTFFEAFTTYTSLISVIGGIVLVLFPGLFPIPPLTQMITSHRGIFAVLWFGLITLPTLYLLSPYGKNSKVFTTVYYLLTAVMALIFATELAVEERWDLSYLTYLMVIFGLFLVWWRNSTVVIQPDRKLPAIFSFIWVSIAVLVGLYVVSDVSRELKSKKEEILLTNFNETTQKLKGKIELTSSILTGFAGSSDIVASIESGDSERNISKAKEIFEKSDVAARVLIYDAGGQAIGVYPRESISQGANLSSRDYFQKTKDSYKGVVSDLYISVIGKKSIMITEPVFKDNYFFGMLGLAIDLEKFSVNSQNEIGKDYFIHAFDSNGVYIFGSNTNDIGKKKQEIVFAGSPDQKESDRYKEYQDSLVYPSWTFLLEAPNETLASDTSYVNILLSVLLLINSAFSIIAGIAIASRKKINMNTVPPGTNTQPLTEPQLNLGGL